MSENGRDTGAGAPPPDGIEHLCMRNLLAAREERFFFKDLQSRFLLVSDGWRASIGRGLPLDEVVGKTDFDFFTRPHAAAALEDEQRIIRTGEAMVAKIERETYADRDDAWVSTSKWPLRDERGQTIGTFGVSRNITEQMQDPATGLANRMALTDRLRQALVGLERQPGCVGLLFLDVDGFKQINDTWGHRTGDQVLAQIAGRLTGVSRRFDTVARYGGDEFVMLLTAVPDEEHLREIGERVMRAVAEPIELAGGRLQLSTSIGSVLCSDPAADPDEVLERVDTAMYAAKRAGGGRLTPYDPGVHAPLGSERG